MKQKLQDLFLLIRQEKKYQVMAVLAAMGVLYLMFADPAPQRRSRAKPKAEESIAINSKEAYEDLMSAMREDLKTVSTGVQENTAAINKLKSDQDQDRARVAEIFKKMLDRLADVQASTSTAMGPGAEPAVMSPEGEGPGGPGNADSGAEIAEFGTRETSVVPPAPPAPRKIAVVAPGDSVRVKLLAGVNAPTDGTPYPVVFKMIDDIHGPDNSALPLGEARIVAAAQGSLTDQRALFRLTTLNIRLQDGRKKIVPVDGWIVGEDGIRGMEGLLIDPIGKAIAGAAMAGTISGIGEGFAQSQTEYNTGFFGAAGQTTISGDPLIYAAGKGASGAANAMSGIIKERMQLYVPHVKVYSGREATAVFSKPVSITDLFETLDNGDSSFANSVD